MSTSESMMSVLTAAPASVRPVPGSRPAVLHDAPVIPAPTAARPGSDAGEFSDHQVTLGGFIFSIAVHLVLLLIMACIVLPQKKLDDLLTIFANDLGQNDGDGDGDGNGEAFELGLPNIEEQDVQTLETNAADVADVAQPQIALDINDLAPSLPAEATSFKGTGVAINIGSEFGGRTEGGRAALVRAGGGSARSEAAVDLGLEWLKKHQQSDGSWSFDHRMDGVCEQQCTQPGVLGDCHTAATAMALLAFLGAGNTPERGKYRREVRQGIAFLIRNMDVGTDGGDLQGEGNYRSMYVHGLAAIALCEAHAMTRNPSAASQATRSTFDAGKVEDPDAATKQISKPERKARGRDRQKTDEKRNSRVRRTQRRSNLSLPQAAQYAVDFVASTQDPEGGGWRYVPRQQGDTSVVGWQLMALESARAGNLKTQPKVFERVRYFLDSVQAQRGSQYGYMTSESGRHSTTAIGLLCRMYLGWGRDNPALRQGIEVLSETGPDFGDMYYNYYATQVLHHWGGEHWKKWNAVMRDHLIETQIKKGHAAGSWDVADRHGPMGGRLYMTCLSIMTLEVYYRHLPLYQRETLGNGL